MFVATGVTVVDPFTYLELNGRGVIVAQRARGRRDPPRLTCQRVWTDDEFGGRELMAKGMELPRTPRWRSCVGCWRRPARRPSSLPPLLPAQPGRLPARNGPHGHPRPRRCSSGGGAQGRRPAGRDPRRPACNRGGPLAAVRELLGSATPQASGVLMAGGEHGDLRARPRGDREHAARARLRGRAAAGRRRPSRRAGARSRQRPDPRRRAGHHGHLPAPRGQPLLRRHDPHVLLRRGAGAAARDACHRARGAEAQHRGDPRRRGRVYAVGGGLRRDRSGWLPHPAGLGRRREPG